MKKVLHLTDTEIQTLRDQIKKEIDTDPLDGGIVVPVGGDGIKRIPTDQTGMPIDPELPADDRAKMAVGIDPDAEEEEQPPEEQPPEEDLEDDKSFLVKNGLKRRKKWVENL